MSAIGSQSRESRDPESGARVRINGTKNWTKNGTRVRMNVAAYQEKEKNEKTRKRKAGEERRQVDFKEAGCYPSAVVQGTARQKNGLCEGSPLQKKIQVKCRVLWPISG